MLRCAAAVVFASAILLAAPALARAADEQAAPPKAFPTMYKLVVEQYGVDGLIGSAEFTVSDFPDMRGTTL